MKSVFLFTLICFLNSSAQNEMQEVNLYNSNIENEKYKLQMLRYESEDAHFISFSRITDSIFLEMKITPSLDKVFNNVSSLENSKLVAMTLLKENENYVIGQINFLDFDSRNISLHKHSADIFLIILDEYQIDIIECVNCTDKVSFIIYENNEK